ncbi:MAG: hypothetical protein WC307_03155 [Candidatus Nanoarchaeia archaeon]|jgi:hypothetical protein
MVKNKNPFDDLESYINKKTGNDLPKLVDESVDNNTTVLEESLSQPTEKEQDYQTIDLFIIHTTLIAKTEKFYAQRKISPHWDYDSAGNIWNYCINHETIKKTDQIKLIGNITCDFLTLYPNLDAILTKKDNDYKMKKEILINNNQGLKIFNGYAKIENMVKLINYILSQKEETTIQFSNYKIKDDNQDINTKEIYLAYNALMIPSPEQSK